MYTEEQVLYIVCTFNKALLAGGILNQDIRNKTQARFEFV